jgi:hypothetical protein
MHLPVLTVALLCEVYIGNHFAYKRRSLGRYISLADSDHGVDLFFFNRYGEMSSSPADFLFFMLWIILINSVSVISNRTNESFRFVMLLLVCGGFLSSMSLLTVSIYCFIKYITCSARICYYFIFNMYYWPQCDPATIIQLLL